MVEASHIREHMDVVGSDDKPVGKVDHVLGQDIQLTRSMGVGKHHLIPIDWVGRVDDKVRLTVTEADAKARWREMN